MTTSENKVFIQKEVFDNEEKAGDGTHFPWVLYISAFSAQLMSIAVGSIVVWPSTVIPKLMSNNTEVNPLGRPITSLETSIIVSTPPFASIFGLLVASKPVDIFGRKRCLFYYAIIMFTCITSIAFTENIYFYYVFFFIYGIIASATIIAVPVYNTEITDDKNRAWLSCWVGLGMAIGNFFSLVLGAIMESVKIYTLVITLPLVLHLLLSYFTVESPVFLIQKKMKSSALIVLRKLRTYDDFELIQREYVALEEYKVDKKVNVFDLFKSYKLRRAFFISFFLIWTQQVSGVNLMFAYMGFIFKEAGTILSGNEVGIVVGFLNIAAGVLCIFIINRFGRRPMLLISALFSSISVLTLSIYFVIKENKLPIVDHIRWLPVVSITVFIISFGIGLGCIPVGYMGELFPNELRATAVSAAIVLAAVLAFCFDFGFPLLTESFGISFGMLLYSVLTFIGLVILFFCLPETRGKSFKEIQVILEGNIFSSS